MPIKINSSILGLMLREKPKKKRKKKRQILEMTLVMVLRVTKRVATWLIKALRK
jgi:hypothetical protein